MSEREEFVLKLAVLEALRRPGEVFTPTQIARILDVSVRRVWNAQEYALKKLRRQIKPPKRWAARPPTQAIELVNPIEEWRINRIETERIMIQNDQ